MKQQVKRGDVYICNLNPVIGSEQGGIRPVIIVSNNTGNKFSPTVVVVPITSHRKNELPTHVTISKKCGLKRLSTACCEQIRTVDKTRLLEKLGYITKSETFRLNSALIRSIEQ